MKTYIEFVVFQYMLMVLAQLLTVESSTVWRHTRNTRVTMDVDTMVDPVLGSASRRRRPLRVRGLQLRRLLPATPGTTTFVTQPHPRHHARWERYFLLFLSRTLLAHFFFYYYYYSVYSRCSLQLYMRILRRSTHTYNSITGVLLLLI